MKKLLWLDDSRNPHENDWLVFSPIPAPFETVWVKSYDEFVAWIEANGLPDAICFDYDLGTEKTGADCALWLAKYCRYNDIDIPAFNSQSADPQGRKDITLFLEYIKHTKRIKKLVDTKDRAGLEAMGIFLPETFYQD